MRASFGMTFLALLLLAGPTVPCADPSGPEAAERQYRIARRLAAEGSPQAGAALRKVVELAPRGPLADDAILEEALLLPLAEWPEEIGRLEMVASPRLRSLLDRVVNEFPEGDRATEARFRRGLLELEPVPGHDPGAARADLIFVATSPSAASWGGRARYSLAWLLEREGLEQRAREAYMRLVVDAPESEAGTRARAALGRIALREARFGDAAGWFQAALDRDPQVGALSVSLRECAVRRVLEPIGAIEADGELRTLPVQAADDLLETPAGLLLLADRKQGRVQAFRKDATVAAQWSIVAPTDLVLDEAGQPYALGADAVYRLEAGGSRSHAAAIGDYGPATAIAAGRGGFWVLDRKGQRVGRVPPGAPAPRQIWQGRGARLVDMVWDGRRLVALDARSKSLIVLSDRGTSLTLTASTLDRPSALAADPSGRIAILDPRAAEVSILSPAGVEVRRFSTEELGMEQPVAIAFALDGSLHLFDESVGLWVRLP
jgi:hypothetical protein